MSADMWDRGLKSQNASNWPRAAAISGFWFGSVKVCGSLVSSFEARSLLWCSCSGRTFAKDRILGRKDMSLWPSF